MVADGLPGRSGKSCSERCAHKQLLAQTAAAAPYLWTAIQLFTHASNRPIQAAESVAWARTGGISHHMACLCSCAMSRWQLLSYLSLYAIKTGPGVGLRALCVGRWRIYLTPGVKRPTQEPFNEYEVAVIYLVRHSGCSSGSRRDRTSSRGGEAVVALVAHYAQLKLAGAYASAAGSIHMASFCTCSSTGPVLHSLHADRLCFALLDLCCVSVGPASSWQPVVSHSQAAAWAHQYSHQKPVEDSSAEC
jgi:hypothetical protein